MKYYLLLFVFLLYSCASYEIVKNTQSDEFDLHKFEESTISVYYADLLANSKFNERPPSDIVMKYIKKAFATRLPHINLQEGSLSLPKSYLGELSLHPEKEMEEFLKKQKCDFVVIFTLVGNDIFVATPGDGDIEIGDGGPASNHSIIVEIWDPHSNSKLLDFSVYQIGRGGVNSCIKNAAEYLANPNKY